MFEYIRKHELSSVVFGPFQPKFDESEFSLGVTDCKDFYGYIEEYIPQGMMRQWVRVNT